MSILSDGWTSLPFLYQDTVALGDACTIEKKRKINKYLLRTLSYFLRGMYFTYTNQFEFYNAL